VFTHLGGTRKKNVASNIPNSCDKLVAGKRLDIWAKNLDIAAASSEMEFEFIHNGQAVQSPGLKVS
jgi:hypothetical protein